MIAYFFAVTEDMASVPLLKYKAINSASNITIGLPQVFGKTAKSTTKFELSAFFKKIIIFYNWRKTAFWTPLSQIDCYSLYYRHSIASLYILTSKIYCSGNDLQCFKNSWFVKNVRFWGIWSGLKNVPLMLLVCRSGLSKPRLKNVELLQKLM